MNQKWESIFMSQGETNFDIVLEIFKKYLLQINFKIINVVGTNGKGSVSSYIAQGLISNGYNVGLFTSPHIFIPNERIKVNFNNISDVDFFRIYNDIKSLISNENINFHFFTWMYLVAMIYFAEKEVDFVILEAGIGGLHDVTNVYDGNVGVVTSIGLDHEEILGETLEKIAVEKAGIINKNMNFYLGNDLSENIREIFMEQCSNNNANSILVNNIDLNYQNRNMKLASAILQNEFNIKFNNFETPMFRTNVFTNNNLKTILDVAHNYDGIKASLQKLKMDSIDFDQVVISMNKSKNIKGLAQLFHGKKIFAYQIDNNFHHADDFNVEKITNIDSFFKNQSKSTLYIGSFRLIEKVGQLCLEAKK